MGVVLQRLPRHPVTVPEHETLQLVAQHGESLQDAGRQVLAVADVQGHDVRVPLQQRPQEVVSQELEAGQAEVPDVMRGCDDLKCFLGQSLVVAEVQAPVVREEVRDETVQLRAAASDMEEV